MLLKAIGVINEYNILEKKVGTLCQMSSMLRIEKVITIRIVQVFSMTNVFDFTIVSKFWSQLLAIAFFLK